jgi:hypothetical protein
MFSTRRLSTQLAPLGFFNAVDSTHEVWFVRPNTTLQLFEIIQVSASKPQGTRGARWRDAAFAGVSIALTPGEFTSPKGMSEYQMLLDHSETRTSEQALSWEQLVVATAPPEIEVLLRTRAGELLARTAETRATVAKYLQYLDRNASVAQHMEALTRGASEAELREARRLATTEGIIGLPERACYDLAALVITRYAERVEGSATKFWGVCPNAVQELKWRMHLIASELFPERGWEMLAAAGSLPRAAWGESGEGVDS